MLSEKDLPVVMSLMLDSPNLWFGAGGIGFGCGCLGDKDVGALDCGSVGVGCVDRCWWVVGVSLCSAGWGSSLWHTRAGSGVVGVCWLTVAGTSTDGGGLRSG